jgi:hypothetical protein
VRNLYFHPRDEHGQIILSSQDDLPLTFEEVFWAKWRWWGFADHWIKARWREACRQQGGPGHE